jgi:hypothetical protein
LWLLVFQVLAAFKRFASFFGQNFKLSSQRTDCLYKMISDGSWRQAPLALQMAYVDAFFRHELDDRPVLPWIATGETDQRHPWRMVCFSPRAQLGRGGRTDRLIRRFRGSG